MSKYWELKYIFHTWCWGPGSDVLVLDPYNSLVKRFDGGYEHLGKLYYVEI